MNSGYVIYVTDTETTGFDPITQDVIEISMSRLVPNDKGYDEEQRSWLVKAINPKNISEEALKKNGHKREDVIHLTKFGKDNYKLPAEVINEIDAWMMEDNVSALDRVFAGQNPKFDVDFLLEMWNREKRKSDFPFEIGNGNRLIDTKTIATLYDVCTGRRRKYYNLGSLVKACGIKKDKAHRADGDVRMTRDLMLFMIMIIKETVAEKFKDCYTAEDE